MEQIKQIIDQKNGDIELVEGVINRYIDVLRDQGPIITEVAEPKGFQTVSPSARVKEGMNEQQHSDRA
jgi:hypothetical protein